MLGGFGGSACWGWRVLCWGQPGGVRAHDIEVPTLPEPVAIEVDPAKTALLVLDISLSNRPARPACVASLPSIKDLLGRAHAAGMRVVQMTSGAAIMPEIAPVEGELIATFGGDKFYRTDLAAIWESAGVDTAIVVGTSANVAVMYMAYALNVRGYTVAVAEDGISSNTDFQTFYAKAQILNSNPQNEPLRGGAGTSTRSDLITIRLQELAG